MAGIDEQKSSIRLGAALGGRETLMTEQGMTRSLELSIGSLGSAGKRECSFARNTPSQGGT